MSYNLDGGVDLKLKDDDKIQLGKEFQAWIERVEDSRRQLMQETWVQALDAYEGKEPIKQFPWPGASNAFLPMTGTHTDALSARLYNAATAHDPQFLLSNNRAGNLLDILMPDGQRLAVSYEEWARWWQEVSKHIERSKVNLNQLWLDVTQMMATYGDAFVYIPWEIEVTNDYSYDLDEKKVVATERTLYNGPRPKVLHPKDVYLEWEDFDIQLARKVGIGWNLDLGMVNQREASGYYSKEDAEYLRTRLGEKSKVKAKDEGNYYKEYGGKFYSKDVFEKELQKRIGITDDSGPNALRMVTCFARIDVGNTGELKEVIFEIPKEDARVVRARYANYLHHKRPLVRFYYSRRLGSAYSKGVPELLKNLQKILNTTIRDHLDNNKVQNTKMFIARKGSPIEENMRAYPGRVIFTDNPHDDFIPVDLGTGRPTTQITDIGTIERWGQYITSITDVNLGKEAKSRTPATTTLSLLEEANKRVDRTIQAMRESMLDVWEQVLMLYFQNGEVNEMAEMAAIEAEDVPKFVMAWNNAVPEDVQKFLTFRAEVSSSALNRQAQRQEGLALFAQIDQFYQRLISMSSFIGGAQGMDPALMDMFLLMTKGYQRSMSKVLDTFDVKDQKDFNPDSLINLISRVTTVDANANATAGASQGSSSPAQQSAGILANPAEPMQPNEAPDRPGAGEARANGSLVSPSG